MEILYFTATWCQPCKVFGPIMENIKSMSNVIKIDIAEDPERVQKYGIMAVPTVVFLKDGQERDRFTGVRTEQDVRMWIDSIY